MTDPRIATAVELMSDFAERTGLTAEREQTRYLWTDAFAVCNYLGLSRLSRDGERFQRLALSLVDRVHHTLGRHRDDDPRDGWLSGLQGAEAEDHPTRGGLRIGKKLPERTPDEPWDERLEWDRDGQYFHYLTKWMLALDLVSRATRQPRFNRWARELATVAYSSFVYDLSDASTPRMYWKMSIDLSRPLVSSMGHHDPLDGLITYRQLDATAMGLGTSAGGPDLGGFSTAFAAMIEGRNLATSDPLGLGGLLIDAFRVAQLIRQNAFPDDQLLGRLLVAALDGLEASEGRLGLEYPASRRLAFRELGLSIGLHAVESLGELAQNAPADLRLQPANRRRIEELQGYRVLRQSIESFWLEPEHRRDRTWLEHRDINEVMLATSLVPEGCLVYARF